MRTTLQSCVTKHIYICSLQVCTPGRGTRKSHAIQPAPLPRERSEPIMNEIAEKGTEGGGKNANAELSATGMRSADSESETATMVQSEMREGIDTGREKTADR